MLPLHWSWYPFIAQPILELFVPKVIITLQTWNDEPESIFPRIPPSIDNVDGFSSSLQVLKKKTRGRFGKEMFREKSGIQILIIMLKEKLLHWFVDIIRMVETGILWRALKWKFELKRAVLRQEKYKQMGRKRRGKIAGKQKLCVWWTGS